VTLRTVLMAAMLAAMATLTAGASTASATQFAGQQSAPPAITDLVGRAEVFWHQHGVYACPGGVMAWEAPNLVAGDGDAWGRGDGATCEIWVSADLTSYAAVPLWLGNAIEACTAVTHEVGHAYGLPHSPRGVMAGSGAPAKMYGWSPRFCFRWARFTLAAVLRGDGETEKSIRRVIRRGMRLIESPG
jgi:hypothetical protein